MSSTAAFRLWLGWRASHLVTREGGWGEFKKSLAETFIPATWEFMTKFGLCTYVPSILSDSSATGWPEEVALLCYESKESYGASKDTVLGRSYSSMHRAIFEFDVADRRSKSGWAESLGADKPTLWSANVEGARFEDLGAHVHVLVLSSPGRLPSIQSIAEVMAGKDRSVAAWCQLGFAVIWVAAKDPMAQDEMCAPLLKVLQGTSVSAFHRATSAPPIEQRSGIPVVEQHSWLFRC